MAVRQVNYWHHEGYEWLLDGDLVKYFDNVRHPRLLDEVVERLGGGNGEVRMEKWDRGVR